MTSLPSTRRTSYLPWLSTDDSLYGVTASLPSGLYRWFWQSPAGFLQFISHHPQKWSVTQSPNSMHPSISPRSTGLVYFTPPPLRKLHSRISSGLQDVLITAKTAWSHPVGARNLNQNRQPGDWVSINLTCFGGKHFQDNLIENAAIFPLPLPGRAGDSLVWHLSLSRGIQNLHRQISKQPDVYLQYWYQIPLNCHL